MDISERLKKLRELFNITSNDLAKITGIHPVSIRKYETKKMVPGIDVIDKMSKALKLPRAIFEDTQEQFTDYNFTGDFYQQLFALIENGTLQVNGEHSLTDPHPKEGTWLSLNQTLSKHIQVFVNGDIVPLENIRIDISADGSNALERYCDFLHYLNLMQMISTTKQSDKYDSSEYGESKEERIHRLSELAEEQKFELMLADHNWQQYMNGIGKSDADINADLEAHIKSGGDFYSFIAQSDLPETVKKQYIESYEDAYVKELIETEIGLYPGDGTEEEKTLYIRTKIAKANAYKEQHPEYKKEAMKHAKDAAKKARQAYSTEQ